MSEEVHEITLLVWDVPALITAGQRFTVKVGAKCSAECILTDGEIEVHTVSGRLSPAPLVGTTALYWTELELASPPQAGSFAWDVKCSVPAHQDACTTMPLTVAPFPDHAVLVKATEKGTPVCGLEIRLGRYRSRSDEAGCAALDVPRGLYELNVWKEGYELLTRTVDVVADVVLSLEVTALPAEEEAYWM